MVTKRLYPTNTNKLVNRIRNTRNRRITFRRPRFEYEDGRSTVFSLYSGSSRVGTIRATSSHEAERLTTSGEVDLTIGWDSNRNETVEATFVTT